jgi:hypothetical protein
MTLQELINQLQDMQSELAIELSAQTQDAYSVSNYAAGEWTRCIQMLLNRGYDAQEAEAIMRSKWTRWACDMSDREYGANGVMDLMAFLDDPRNNCTKANVRKLVEGKL